MSDITTGKTISYSEIKESFTDERRKRIEEQANDLEAEMALRDIAKALKLSQKELAARMGKSQSEISKMFRRNNMQLNTLKKFAESLDGELEVIIKLPEGEKIPIAV